MAVMQALNFKKYQPNLLQWAEQMAQSPNSGVGLCKEVFTRLYLASTPDETTNKRRENAVTGNDDQSD